MVDATVLSTIFTGVNEGLEGLDDDGHEFSYEEFYVAMCLIAVYCNKPMDAIVFPVFSWMCVCVFVCVRERKYVCVCV
jgi:hypothetical protein